MRNYKKYLAATLAATMVLGSSTVAFASSTSSRDYVSSSDTSVSGSNSTGGSITGNGGVEGSVDKEVFHVVVPTSIVDPSVSFDAFDFVLDPENLITKTQAQKYMTGSNAATGFDANKTLYFVNKTSKKLTDTSDFVKVTNKSSVDVQIQLNAQISNNGSITVSDKKTFTDKATSMYLALTDGTTEKAISTAGTTVKSVIGAAPSGAYETRYNDTTGQYEYTLKEDLSSVTFKTYEFALTGASNSAGDWSTITAGTAPQVDITWSVGLVPDAAPSIATTSYTNTGAAIEVDVDLGSGDKKATGITSIKYVNSAGEDTILATDKYSFENGVLRFRPSYLSGLTATRVFTVVFNDADATEIEVTLTKSS